MKIALFLLLFLSMVYGKVGIVSALVGKADVIRNGKKIPLHLKDPIEVKDTVITYKDSKVQLLFDDETVVTVGKESRLVIQEYLYRGKSSKASFSMVKGFFRSLSGKIGKIAPKRFLLKTKNSTIGIRGTEIVVITFPAKEDKIACLEGAIEVVSNYTKRSVQVISGYFTIVKQKRDPLPPQKIEKDVMIKSAIQETSLKKSQTSIEQPRRKEEKGQKLLAKEEEMRQLSVKEVSKKTLEEPEKIIEIEQITKEEVEKDISLKEKLALDIQKEEGVSSQASSESSSSSIGELIPPEIPYQFANIYSLKIGSIQRNIHGDGSFDKVVIDARDNPLHIEDFFHISIGIDPGKGNDGEYSFNMHAMVQKDQKALEMRIEGGIIDIESQKNHPIQIALPKGTKISLYNNGIKGLTHIQDQEVVTVVLEKTLINSDLDFRLDTLLEALGKSSESQKIKETFKELENYLNKSGVYRVEVDIDTDLNLLMTHLIGEVDILANESNSQQTTQTPVENIIYQTDNVTFGYKQDNRLGQFYLKGEKTASDEIDSLIQNGAHAIYTGVAFAVKNFQSLMPPSFTASNEVLSPLEGGKIITISYNTQYLNGLFVALFDLSNQQFRATFDLKNQQESLIFTTEGTVDKNHFQGTTFSQNIQNATLDGDFYGSGTQDIGGFFGFDKENSHIDGGFAGGLKYSQYPIEYFSDTKIDKLIAAHYNASFKGEVYINALSKDQYSGKTFLNFSFGDQKFTGDFFLLGPKRVDFHADGTIKFIPTNGSEKRAVFDSTSVESLQTSGVEILKGKVEGLIPSMLLNSVDGLLLVETKDDIISGNFIAQRELDEVLYESETLSFGYWTDEDMNPVFHFDGVKTPSEAINSLVINDIKATYIGNAFGVDEKKSEYRGDFRLNFSFGDQKFDGDFRLMHENTNINFSVNGDITQNSFYSTDLQKSSSSSIDIRSGSVTGSFYGNKAQDIGGNFILDTDRGFIHGGFAGGKQ